MVGVTEAAQTRKMLLIHGTVKADTIMVSIIVILTKRIYTSLKCVVPNNVNERNMKTKLVMFVLLIVQAMIRCNLKMSGLQNTGVQQSKFHMN